ncbi:DNA-binding IclR family transcriptional regulator [Arthrobacter sp. CAN_A6]|uniref:IclR family transcriptional regulator n=1 Tax=Arthrobacter sp. CAN_A6 TaxID=2787721 RepID=UPI0018CBE0FE
MVSSGTPAAAPLLVLKKISDILDAFSLRKPELTLTDIREATGLPTSTVQRLVGNLVANGFLDKMGDHYRVGLKMAFWAAPATQNLDRLEVVKPVLQDLRDKLGETVCFFEASMNYRVCVAMAETRHILRREMKVGRLLPLHAGSAGRVLLAWNDELLRDVLADSLDQLTETTITDRSSLSAAVEQTRRDGYAITTGERQTGASGLSAPVFDSQADLLGAVTIMGPTLRMPLEVCERWVEDLLAAAEQVTRMLGGRHPDDAAGRRTPSGKASTLPQGSPS